MKLKYAFNLGRVYTLSLAELFAVFEQMKLRFNLVDLYEEILVIETDTTLDVEELQSRLGGTIKIFQVFDHQSRKKDAKPSYVFEDYFDYKLLRDKYLTDTSGKTVFGVSVYPMAPDLPSLHNQAKRLAMDIKKIIKVQGDSVRAVIPQRGGISLPSVVVTKEHLLEKGTEIVFLVAFDKIWVGKTLVVQDFEDYGRRDYQRPATDMKIGMLPPKVAQTMINLAQLSPKTKGKGDRAVLDPFVGAGTVIQELMLQDYKGIGTDIDEDAIRKAETNLEWLRNRYSLPPGRFEVRKADATNLPEGLPEKIEIEAIVSELTLGPNYSELPDKQEREKNFENLSDLYIKSFKAFKKMLSKGKRVVVAFPAYRLGEDNYEFIDILDKIKNLGYNSLSPFPEVLLENFPFLKVTKRNSIIYDRKDQFVSREIIIFEVN